MVNFINRIIAFIKSLFSSAKLKNENTTNLREVPVEIARKPGLKCPECGTLITVTMEQIIAAGSVYCTNCFLELKIDAGKSAASIDALKKLKQGLSEAEKIKKEGNNF